MNIQKALLVIALAVLFASFKAYAVVADVNNPQGALWNLRENGQVAEANALEVKLSRILLTGELNAAIQLPSRTSPGYIVRFPHNIFAVMKKDDPRIPNSHRSDVASYIVDRALELHMVPLTVMREFGGEMYSLQLFYPSFQGTRAEAQKSEFGTSRFYDLALFDNIIGNRDRIIHDMHNVMVGADGRMIAIDHARTFEGDQSSSERDFIQSSREMRRSIAKLSIEKLDQSLSGIISTEKRELLMKRLSALKTMAATSQNGEEAPSAHRSATVIPENFKVPAELAEKAFVDFFQVELLLGPQSHMQDQREVLKAIKSVRDANVLVGFAVKYWDGYSLPVKKALLPAITESPYFPYNHVGKLEEILRKNPEFAVDMLKEERFARNALPFIIRGLFLAGEKHFTPEVRNLIRRDLKESFVKFQTGIDFDDTFRGPELGVKVVILGELYQDMKKWGLHTNAAKLFRLQYFKNLGLGSRIVGSLPENERSEARESLMNSLLALQKDMPPSMARDVEAQLQDLRTMDLRAPLCPMIFWSR